MAGGGKKTLQVNGVILHKPAQWLCNGDPP